MKLFKNIETEILASDAAGAEKVGYAFFVSVLLNVTPKEGWTSAAMRKRFPVEDKFKDIKLNDEILLENSDVELLVSLLDVPWTMKHKNIIEFEDYLRALHTGPDAKVTAAKGGKK